MLLELLESDTSLHDFGGVVDFSVLNDLEAVEDHALKSAIALAVTSEGAALEEAGEELLEHDELGEVAGEVSESLEFSLSLGLNTLELGLDNVGGELKVSEHGLVHDGLDGHVVELLHGQLSLHKIRYTLA